MSGIMKRKRDNGIGCYIRIPEDYVSDEYISIPEGVKEIVPDDNTTVQQTADKIAEYFRFDIWYHSSLYILCLYTALRAYLWLTAICS